MENNTKSDRNRWLSSILTISVLALGVSCGSSSVNEDATDDTTTDVTDAADTSIDVPDDGEGDTSTDGDGGCSSNDDCDDGVYCNGAETCGSTGECESAEEVDCDDSNPCTMDNCDEDSAGCDNDPLDADGDGFVAIRAPTGEECSGDDCNDSADDIYPGAPETDCDLEDSDCDGSTAEHIDDDLDGWIDESCDGIITDPGSYDGLSDCDDDLADVYPGAPEGCDGTVDNDCDGDATEVETDADSDGFGPASCGGSDCDDSDGTIFPGAVEVCDDVDDDCDSEVLDAAGADDDSDTVLDIACGGTDCDDTDASIFPGAAEVCDDVDDDCDGLILDADGADDDLDTVLDIACGGTDCNDLNPDVYPGQPEDSCDTTDNDCDGDAIDGIADMDDDDFLNDACLGGNDCDDSDATVHPSATEICDDIDQDCDGEILDAPGADDDGDLQLDETCGGYDCDDTDADIRRWAPDNECDLIDYDCDGSTTEHIDDDLDGWIDAACDGVITDPGTYDGLGDCNDTNDSINPGATLVCDDVDNDCSGDFLDEPGADDDSDTVLDQACGGTDCDDTDATIHPGATEICYDWIDEDCDTIVDGPHLLASELRVTNTSSAGSLTPAVSWSGSEFGVTMRDGFPYDVRFNAIAEDGSSAAPWVSILTSTGSVDHSDSTWSGSEYGVTYWDRVGASEDENAVMLARLDGSGSVIGSATNLTAATASPWYMAIAWSGSTWGIAWREDRDGNNEIYFSLAAADATPMVTDLRVTDNLAVSTLPDLVWTGSEFAVVWQDNSEANNEIYLSLIADDGSSAGSPIRVTSDASSSINPDACWTTSTLSVAWEDNRDGNNEIYYALLDATGAKIGSDVRVTSTTEDSEDPRISCQDGFVAVVWQEGATPRPQLHLATLDLDGLALGTPGQVSFSDGAEIPSMSWSGSTWGIAWQGNFSTPREIYFNVVSACE